MNRGSGSILLMVLLCVTPAQARAPRVTAPKPPPATTSAAARPVVDESERPWAAGVTPAAQARALEIFKQGNALFEESRHAEAMAKYKDALAIWDHPAIRYNLAVALIHLDQPLSAYENLVRGLRFGAAPLGAEVHNQALTYKKLLLGQLAELKVSCVEPTAQVSLDGEPLFVAPGQASRLVVPGRHQLVASRTGYLTETRAVLLLPGAVTEETLKLVPIGSVVTRRRWAVWKPPVVLAAGVLAAAIGIPLILSARSEYASYDSAVKLACPDGCPPAPLPASVQDQKTRGDAEYRASIGLFAAGGAVAVAGLVLVLLNQPRVVEGKQPSRVSIAPVLGPGIVAGSLAVRF